MAFHRINKRLAPNSRGVDLVRARDMGDLYVPERDKMLHGFVDPDGVIQDNIAYFFADKAEVLKHKTGLFSLRLFYQGFVKLGDHQDYARDPHLDQPLYILHRASHFVIRIEQKQDIPAGNDRRLDALDDLGKEGVWDVRDKQPDDLALAQCEALGVGIWVIV